jgi:hypothetical protein
MRPFRRCATVSAVAALAWAAVAGAEPAWTPEAWADEDTLEMRTTDPGAEPHWSKVWLVVLDGAVYVRLGTRATERIEANTTKPEIGLRIAGQEFARVRGEPAPEMAERVAAAMAEKYTSDVLIRYFAHPLTMRLVPVDE